MTYPCAIGSKFIDHFNGEVATVTAFREHGRGFQVCFSTPRLDKEYHFRCSWTQFKRNYKPMEAAIG